MQEISSISIDGGTSMLKIIRNFFTRSAEAMRAEPDWRQDPLSHPVLQRMTPDELADLPLGQVRYADNQNGNEAEKLCA
jgi:hypothetical protein